MPPAQQLIADGIAEKGLVGRRFRVADDDGFTRVGDLAVHDSRIVRRPRTAPAARLDLHRDTFVRDLEQPLGSLEELAAEIGDEPECEDVDTELVDLHGLSGIGYTHRREEAVEAVDGGAADVAYLLRAPRVDDVFTVARRRERMPQKSTYFFPKPLSGLLFHPLDL